ncbi:MAG: tetratricopeptide repeat protein [Candidatus Krumholzibacteriia bacterium]
MTESVRRIRRFLRTAAVAAACAAILAFAGAAAFAQDPVKETDKKPVRQPRRQEPSSRRQERPKPVPPEKGRASEAPGAMMDRANHFLMQERCVEAIPILERLTTEYPRIAAANEMLAGCYIKEGRAQDAASLLERCLKEEPGQFAYARDLGRAYMDLGRREDAVAVWRSLLASDEKTATMYGHVAKMEQEAGLYDEAIETLRAGTGFKETAEYYSREIIRLERVIGREEDAFRDALLLIGQRQGAFEGEIRGVTDIFRESKKRERLVALLDSTIAAGSDRSGIFRTLKTIFLIEAERYDDARKHLFGKGAPVFREDELYALLLHMGRMPPARVDMRFTSIRVDLMRLFLERFDSSAFAPHVRVMAAESTRESARSASGPERERLLGEALALCDAAKRSGLGAPYFDKAAIMKAQVYFEDMQKSGEALAELSNVGRRNVVQRLEAEELRGRILLASGNWRDAAAELGRIAADADTSVALLGRYGLGRLAFLAGRYEESLKTLSDLAEKHPSSPWANDALELAMDVKGAMPEGTGALGLYRAAVLDRSRGQRAAAIDSLAALERRFPESSLAPRAIFMKGEIEAETGAQGTDAGGRGIADGSADPAALDAARADFTRLVESYPLHELAPRALERLAELAARENPAEAISRYGTLMERYPEYPFMERVRERYVALGKTAGAPAPEKGSR